uniref:Proteasome assembly chaperone 4 n=1 Tax=Cyprinus carpio TaxID=7962 RepID=A0A8C1LVP1_CYPCA
FSGGPCSKTPPIVVHDFSEKILEQLVHFHVMKLSGGFFLWIGSSPVLSSLALAINSKYDSTPLSALVLGDTLSKPSKKTKKQVFVSYSLPTTDSNLALLVEDRIKKEMEIHPDKF